MRGYGQYCPIAKAAEVLGDRWTLLILRELLLGSTRFNQLERGLPRISRALLSARLRFLEHAGIVVRQDGAYEITPAGRDLTEVMRQLGEWSARWVVTDPADDELDASLLVWFMHRHVDFAVLPKTPTVLELRFTVPRKEIYWLIMRPGDVEVCLKPPGYDSDVVVEADTATLHRVYLGRTTLAAAMRAGQVTVSGPPRLVRSFPRWFTWSPYAPIVAAHHSTEANRPSGASPR